MGSLASRLHGSRRAYLQGCPAKLASQGFQQGGLAAARRPQQKREATWQQNSAHSIQHLELPLGGPDDPKSLQCPLHQSKKAITLRYPASLIVLCAACENNLTSLS